MKKTILSTIVGASLLVAPISSASVTFSGIGLQSAISGGNPLGLTAGQVGVYVNADSVANWLSFNGTGTIGSGLSLFSSATYGTSITFLGNASVSGTTTLTLSGGAFSPLTYSGGVGAGDEFAVIVFNSSTTTTNPGDTFNVWRANDWVMPVDGSTLTFSATPSTGQIQRVNSSSYLVAAGSVVPEPSTYALMALGGLVLFFMVRRRKIQA